MLQRLYYRFLRYLLASTEDHLESVAKLLGKIETRTDLLQRGLEEEAVKLAHNAAHRRAAVEAVNASYDRKDSVAHGFIAEVNAEIEKAAIARAAVQKFLADL